MGVRKYRLLEVPLDTVERDSNHHHLNRFFSTVICTYASLVFYAIKRKLGIFCLVTSFSHQKAAEVDKQKTR